MRTIRGLIVGAAVALLVHAGTATAAPPDFTAAEKLCAAQDGVGFEPSGGAYRCNFIAGELSEPEVRAARALCESAYNGSLLANLFPGTHYICTTP